MRRHSIQCCAFSMKDYMLWTELMASAGLVDFSLNERARAKKVTVVQFEESHLLVRSALS